MMSSSLAAGGHGLATAYYLAKQHGITMSPCLRKAGSAPAMLAATHDYPLELPARRQRSILRMVDEAVGRSRHELITTPWSATRVINLYHPIPSATLCAARQCHEIAWRRCRLLDVDGVRALLPYLDFDDARFPIRGGPVATARGNPRHDAWSGLCPRGDKLGVDIIQNCEVTGIPLQSPRHLASRRPGARCSGKVAHCVAGSSSRVGAMAGMRPAHRKPRHSSLRDRRRQTAGRPCRHLGAGHFYISQSDKGGLVFRRDLDGYNSYAQRGNLPAVEDVCEGGMAMMRGSSLRIVRSWGGLIDMSMDGSPIIDHTSIEGLYLNGAWNYGGFKRRCVRLLLAHLIARTSRIRSHGVPA